MTKRRFWPLVRALWVPVLMAALAFLLLREPLVSWLQGDDRYDQEALAEWVREARVYETLPDLVNSFLHSKDRLRELESQLSNADPSKRPTNDEVQAARHQVNSKRVQIGEHIQWICEPVNKVYPGRLPLFVAVYSFTVRFDDNLGEKPIVWDSGKPRQPTQYRELSPVKVSNRGVWVDMQHQLRVYDSRQFNERQALTRWRWLSGLGLLLAIISGIWIFLSLRQQRQRELRRMAAEQKANAAQRLRLEEALKRQEAERRQEVAERTALELKSQLFANIGIMAGSYAHNIKNLLVRPSDLLGRCLERDGLSGEQNHMLQEVRQTLGTVTERLQQILQTVRRDPSRSDFAPLDLNALARELYETWREMSGDKWKLELHLDLVNEGEPLWVSGDRSHLQQALENLLFNGRDATFEMRNRLREQARKGTETSATHQSGATGGLSASVDAAAALADKPPVAPGQPVTPMPRVIPTDGQHRRQALIQAAGWKGQIWIRTEKEDGKAVLEIEDNGVGMSDEVRRRCTETHFSTKRDNALFAGLSAGMGLGLSFVVVILEHHQASLEIASEPLHGARFRVTFPPVKTS